MRVVAFVPDLLFGSTVLSAIKAAGHEPVPVGDPEALARELPGAQALIVDLTAEAAERIALAGRSARPDLRIMGFYAHVEGEVRAKALESGFDLVVPRSRMAREGAALIQRLSIP